MGTTQQHAHGGQGNPPDIVDSLTRLFLAARDVLPHAPNGKPTAPSDPSVAQILKDMAQGRSCEFRRLRKAALCNRRDGVPAALVTAALRQLIAEIEMTEPTTRRAHVDRAIITLVRNETRAQARLDLAQLRIAESPTSIAAIEETLREAALYRGELDALEVACERTLSVVRNQPREVVGARMQVVR